MLYIRIEEDVIPAEKTWNKEATPWYRSVVVNDSGRVLWRQFVSCNDANHAREMAKVAITQAKLRTLEFYIYEHPEEELVDEVASTTKS